MLETKKVEARGLYLLVRPETNDDEIVKEVIRQDIYGLLEHEKRPFKSILDLGGHIGSFAFWASTIWPDAKILSFEPTDDNSEMFETNTRDCKNVTLVRKAVTAKTSGEASFFIPDYCSANVEHNSGDGRLVDFKKDSETKDTKPTMMVPAISIAEVFDEHGPFDFVKMDIEDAEFGILQVMHDKGLIDQVPFIRGEFHRPNFLSLKKANFPNHELGGVYIFSNLGYFYANRH